MIQDAKEKTVNHLFLCGEPAWLAELASLTSLSRGETFGGVAKCLRLQRSTTQKKAKKSVKKCICVLLNIWRSFEMAQLVKYRQNLLGLNF